MKKLRVWVLIVVCLVQLGFIIWMPVENSLVLANGNVYKMKITSVDPYDPFRGNYLTVEFKQRTTQLLETDNVYKMDIHSKKVYLVFGKGENGVDQIDYATLVKPVDRDYTIAKAVHMERMLHFSMPFDSYYVNEKDAPAMEAALARNIKDAYATIRVRNGKAVLDKLYIGDRTIEEYVEGIR